MAEGIPIQTIKDGCVTEEIKRQLLLMDNLSLNILIAENVYNLPVIHRPTFPKNRRKFYYNIKVDFIEKPLPNYVRETKNLLKSMLDQGYNVFMEKQGILYKVMVNDYEIVEEYERAVAIALLLNILEKQC